MLKAVSGKIIYGTSKDFITEPHSVYLQPGIRYDHPLKLSKRGNKPRYISLTFQSGFLFCKAQPLDPLLFRTKNPTYLPVSIGLSTRSVFSAGIELFYWKGLGNRDLLGLKFPTLGINGSAFRLYLTAEHYAQLRNTRNKGSVFSVEFSWKLIKGK
ncbi:MAG: hypothetical protein NTW29_10520 [Bacteroidetes bacterium]|nr:hypothetical protein [Bacteroidota bacterium]